MSDSAPSARGRYTRTPMELEAPGTLMSATESTDSGAPPSSMGDCSAAADYRGEEASGLRDHACDVRGDNDLLTLTRPDVIRDIHHAFLEAGADIIETNTFNATRIAQADYGLQSRVREINFAAARLARECADTWSTKTPGKPRFVAGALGPTNRTATLSPDV